jgi:hypothetical protein
VAVETARLLVTAGDRVQVDDDLGTPEASVSAEAQQAATSMPEPKTGT